MKEEKQSIATILKDIFKRYKLLFVVYCTAFLLLPFEGRVTSENGKMLQENAITHMLDHIDEDNSYYHFLIEHYQGRHEGDYYLGIKAFKQATEARQLAQKYGQEEKPEQQKIALNESVSKLLEAKGLFEKVIDSGVISNNNLLVFHCLTLKLLGVPEDEMQAGIKRLRKHFPFMDLPEVLSGY